MNIAFFPTAWAQYVEWQAIDKSVIKKINDLIQDIQRNGLASEIGKPESLKL
jgi:toxin YoeB